MLSEKENTRISKFLSLVLRHQPQTIGLSLDEQGWALVGELINKMNNKGFAVNESILEHIVSTNNKKRFAYNDTKTKIRASQGHSLTVALDLKETEPPPCLYHGTGENAVASILLTGLEKRSRQHVHLSTDIQTAKSVGQRHGKPRVFVVDTAQMRKDGFSFYLSENNVWLTDYVPAQYLSFPGGRTEL